MKGTVKGWNVISLTTCLEQQGDHTASKKFADLVCTCLSGILDKSRHEHKLPSAIMGKVWGQFHKIHFDQVDSGLLFYMWTNLID